MKEFRRWNRFKTTRKRINFHRHIYKNSSRQWRTSYQEALFKIILKGNKKPNNKNSEDYKLIAYHEAGHALCAKLLTKKSIPKVTIIGSTSGAGGVTFMTPKDGLHTKEDLINEIKISYAGRAA